MKNRKKSISVYLQFKKESLLFYKNKIMYDNYSSLTNCGICMIEVSNDGCRNSAIGNSELFRLDVPYGCNWLHGYKR